MLNFGSDIDGHEHAYVRCEHLYNKDTILYNVQDMSSMISWSSMTRSLYNVWGMSSMILELSVFPL